MKKISLKKQIKFIIGFVIGLAIPSLVFAATILYASNEVSYDNSATGFASTDVQEAIDELYFLCSPDEKSSSANVTGSRKSAIKRLSVGDYFILEPDKDKYSIDKEDTGYSEDQEIKPNELTLWRVININDNRTIDAVSEYVSSDNVYFKGVEGYSNIVGELQKIAEEYKKDGYTSSVRIIGFDDQTLNITNKSSFDGTNPSDLFEASDITTGSGVEVMNGEYGDTLYIKDYLLVSDLYKEDKNEDNYCESGLCAYEVDTKNKSEYWLASRGRDISKDPKISYYTGRSIDKEGKLLHNNLLRGYNLDNHEWNDYSSFSALRPIITLYSTIGIDKGEGTKDNPYTLSK